jgi:hypothetical protein
MHQRVTKKITRQRYQEIHREKEQLVIPGTETKLSNACEDFIELRDAVLRQEKEIKKDKDSLAEANVRVAEHMISAGLETCRHGGLTFRVKEAKEVKPKVVVKEE